MSKELDAIKAKAIADKKANAPPPATLPTQSEQNFYDFFRKAE